MRPDRIDIVVPHRTGHHPEAARLLVAGLRRHGITGRLVVEVRDAATPVVACWGWRLGSVLRRRGHNVLVAERGYVGDRFRWTSLGWNGLNGRAVFPAMADGGARFRRHHAAALKPWKQAAEGPAVIMGQVPTDTAVAHIDFMAWVDATAAALLAAGLEVRYRPHPLATTAPPRLPRAEGDLATVLADAGRVITFNSNSGVDAVLAGCPTIACDAGSMALPVAARGLDAPLATPDRSDWAGRLAWCQWSAAELEGGDFVEPVFAALPS